MAILDGVHAKSNGPNDQCSGTGCAGEGTYGLQYECVEYAQRYFAMKYGTTPYKWGANANGLCKTHPTSVEIASGPAHGRLMVLDMGAYGHVCVINHTQGTDVHCVEQNNHPNGVGIYDTTVYKVLCYLQSKTTSGVSCGSHANGWYCGNDGLNGNANYRYLCDNGKVTQTNKCGFTCVTMPKGQDDECTNTGSCKGLSTSYLCGNDGVGGNANDLYLCKDGNVEGAKRCTNGCEIVSGANDKCK
tara:strand:- start:647 stop:1381 length:735 start_codon:yes stop_codon:yes gene_type:complete